MLVLCEMLNVSIHVQSEKESELELHLPSQQQHVNPEHAARVHQDSNAAAETPAKNDGSQVLVLSSQAQIMYVLEQMCCKEHQSSMQRLPHINTRCQVLHASETEKQHY